MASAASSSALTPGESTVVPSGKVTTGTIGATSPPLPYVEAISRFVSNPSRPGTGNSWVSASDAGWTEAKAAIVTRIQAPATSRLWRSTHRVNVASGSFRAGEIAPPSSLIEPHLT